MARDIFVVCPPWAGSNAMSLTLRMQDKAMLNFVVKRGAYLGETRTLVHANERVY